MKTFGLYKKPVDDDRVKAISDFQNRLWNLKPDLTFVKKETVHVTDDEAGDSIRNLKVTIDETEMDNCSSKPIRDEIYKKVITPSESFDDVLYMSEDVSDIPTGDEFSDVISDLAVKENAGSLVEDGKDEAGTVTVPASEPDFTMDPSSPGKEIDHNANTTPSDATEADAFVCKIESNPTEKTSEENSADEQVKDYIKPLKEKVLLVKTYENLTQGNDSQQDLEAMEEKVKVANDVLEAAKLDYPVILKPNYPVQEKPDYPVLEKPDYPIQEKPDYQVQRKPDYPVTEKINYAITEKPDYPVTEKLDHQIMKKQDISSRLKLDGSVGKQSVAQDSTSVGKGKSDEEGLDNFEKQTNSAENEEVQHVVTKELYDLDKQTISAEIDEVQHVVTKELYDLDKQ